MQQTTNHGYRKWADDEEPWDQRAEWDKLELEVPIIDTDANRSTYEPTANARYFATDTQEWYVGDGSSWNPLPVSGGPVTGDLEMADFAELLFGVGGDIEARTDSAISGEENAFVIETIDESGGDTIWWRRKANSTDAFEVRNNTTGTSLLRVRDDGEVAIREYIDLYSRDGSGDKWRFITYDTTGNFVFQHYPSGGGFTDGFEIDANGNVTFPSGTVTASSGTIQQQRGAPTTTELADGERMQYTSDGSDGNAAGDLVSARNNAGTIVDQVIAAAADDA